MDDGPSAILSISPSDFFLEFTEFKSFGGSKTPLRDFPEPLRTDAERIVLFLHGKKVTTFQYDRSDRTYKADTEVLEGSVQDYFQGIDIDAIETLDLILWYLHHKKRVSLARERQHNQDLETTTRNRKLHKGGRKEKYLTVTWTCLDCGVKTPSVNDWCPTAGCACWDKWHRATGEVILQEVKKHKSA